MLSSIISSDGSGTVFSVLEKRVLFAAAGIKTLITGVRVEFLTDIDGWVDVSNSMLSVDVESVVDDVIGAVFWTAICTDVVIDSVIIGAVMSSKSPKKSWVCRLNWIWLFKSFT